MLQRCRGCLWLVIAPLNADALGSVLSTMALAFDVLTGESIGIQGQVL